MKKKILQDIRSELEKLDFTIIEENSDRPWGGYFVLDELQAERFAHTFFSDVNLSELYITGKLSPKMLVVSPGARLSWQYHLRRSELWQVYRGKVGVVRSNNDIEGECVHHAQGSQIRLAQGERHRLVGLEDFGVVAEIWQHTNEIPSDESDIVRIQDDYHRR